MTDPLEETRNSNLVSPVAPKEPTTDIPNHRYISTACQHGLHEQCRLTCKFCQSPCQCDCKYVGHKSVVGGDSVVTPDWIKKAAEEYVENGRDCDGPELCSHCLALVDELTEVIARHAEPLIRERDDWKNQAEAMVADRQAIETAGRNLVEASKLSSSVEFSASLASFEKVLEALEVSETDYEYGEPGK
jgi:hypothetical protein